MFLSAFLLVCFLAGSLCMECGNQKANYASCYINSESGLKGTIDFAELAPLGCFGPHNPIEVMVSLTGFPQNSGNTEHGLIVKEFGDLSNGCDATGGIFRAHDDPKTRGHRRRRMANDVPTGFLGNFKEGTQGAFKVKSIAQLRGQNSIIGRSLVVLEGPYTNSYKPLGCCVIGISPGSRFAGMPKTNYNEQAHTPFSFKPPAVHEPPVKSPSFFKTRDPFQGRAPKSLPFTAHDDPKPVHNDFGFNLDRLHNIGGANFGSQDSFSNGFGGGGFGGPSKLRPSISNINKPPSPPSFPGKLHDGDSPLFGDFGAGHSSVGKSLGFDFGSIGLSDSEKFIPRDGEETHPTDDGYGGQGQDKPSNDNSNQGPATSGSYDNNEHAVNPEQDRGSNTGYETDSPNKQHDDNSQDGQNSYSKPTPDPHAAVHPDHNPNVPDQGSGYGKEPHPDPHQNGNGYSSPSDGTAKTYEQPKPHDPSDQGGGYAYDAHPVVHPDGNDYSSPSDGNAKINEPKPLVSSDQGAGYANDAKPVVHPDGHDYGSPSDGNAKTYDQPTPHVTSDQGAGYANDAKPIVHPDGHDYGSPSDGNAKTYDQPTPHVTSDQGAGYANDAKPIVHPDGHDYGSPSDGNAKTYDQPTPHVTSDQEAGYANDAKPVVHPDGHDYSSPSDGNAKTYDQPIPHVTSDQGAGYANDAKPIVHPDGHDYGSPSDGNAKTYDQPTPHVTSDQGAGYANDAKPIVHPDGHDYSSPSDVNAKTYDQPTPQVSSDQGTGYVKVSQPVINPTVKDGSDYVSASDDHNAHPAPPVHKPVIDPLHDAHVGYGDLNNAAPKSDLVDNAIAKASNPQSGHPSPLFSSLNIIPHKSNAVPSPLETPVAYGTPAVNVYSPPPPSDYTHSYTNSPTGFKTSPPP